MTDGWDGVSGDDLAYDFEKCYTSLPHDLASRATASHGMQYVQYQPSNIIQGTYCQSYPGVYYTGKSTNTWWQADFGSPAKVSRIRVRIPSSYFTNVSFHLGNSSRYQDNPVVAGPEKTKRPSTSSYGRYLVEVNIAPSVGRYFTITQPNLSWLGMYTVQIF